MPVDYNDPEIKKMIREQRKSGYGLCKGCGGWEPFEVLRQMEGYCTSQCEREDKDA